MSRPRLPVVLTELRAFMRENRLLVAHLARGIGVSKAAAGNIYAGRSAPDPDTRIAVEIWTHGRCARNGWDERIEPLVRRRVSPAPLVAAA